MTIACHRITGRQEADQPGEATHVTAQEFTIFDEHALQFHRAQLVTLAQLNEGLSAAQTEKQGM
jgi:hypothetical protein